MLWLVINLINNNELSFCNHSRTLQVRPHLWDWCPLSQVVVVFRCRLLSSVSGPVVHTHECAAAAFRPHHVFHVLVLELM